MNKKIQNPYIYDDFEFNSAIKKFQDIINMIDFQKKYDQKLFNETFGMMKHLFNFNRYFQLNYKNNVVNKVKFFHVKYF